MNTNKKIGKNSKCSCNSGKKYKKCCYLLGSQITCEICKELKIKGQNCKVCDFNKDLKEFADMSQSGIDNKIIDKIIKERYPLYYKEIINLLSGTYNNQLNS
jgi:hypothetical protein